MDSNTFGIKVSFATLGVLIKLYCSHLDDDLRANEPYRVLPEGKAHAGDSILVLPHSKSHTGIFSSVEHIQCFNAYASLIAVLCEPLIVAIANEPFNPTRAFEAYLIASYFPFGILSMILRTDRYYDILGAPEEASSVGITTMMARSDAKNGSRHDIAVVWKQNARRLSRSLRASR